MVRRLILGLLWLTCVQSDSMPMEPSMSANGMPMPYTEMSSSVQSAEQMSIKSKRYLSHQHSPPCPPFYPHLAMPKPMYAMRPYGPPAYPKNDIHMPMQQHHQLQYIHQPTYTSYVPKQTIQYVKPEISMPAYQHPIPSPPIHHVQPIVLKQPILQSSYHQQYHNEAMYQHKYSYDKQPVYSYAPAYQHKPMPWPMSQIKKFDYPITQIAYNHPKPAIVYKPEAPKCAPCPPAHQSVYQPSISYVKLAQPVHHVEHQSGVYLPPNLHQSVIKPCDK